MIWVCCRIQLTDRQRLSGWGIGVALRVNGSDGPHGPKWLSVPVHDDRAPSKQHRVQIDRDVLNSIMEEDPRPPELLLDLIARRAVKRMPVPNGDEGDRVITPHNLELVWPK